jgi:hypothetical protein
VVEVGRFVQPGAPGEGKLKAKELADIQDIRSDIVERVDVRLRGKRHDVPVVELLVVLNGFGRQVQISLNVNRIGLAVGSSDRTEAFTQKTKPSSGSTLRIYFVNVTT